MDRVIRNATESWMNSEGRLVISDALLAAWDTFWATFGPDGKLNPGALLGNKYHLGIEAILLLGIIYLLIQGRAPAPAREVLTERV
jgi:hypothetical protein